MNTKQTPGNNILKKIDHKHNPHFLWGTIEKLSNKKPPNKTKAFASELKQASLT